MKENGIILIDKPKNITSQDVLNILKKRRANKYGHSGTLDPLATGLMIVLVGNSTKLSDFFLKKDKTYIADIALGKYTDTLDITGKILFEEDVNLDSLDEENIKEVLKKFIGKIKQIPPIYSAIKYNGKKLYDIARKEKKSEEEIQDILNKKERAIEIYNIELLNIDKKNKRICLKIDCSSGTYIRSLARDIGEALGTCATIFNLRRTEIGNFKIEDAFKLDEINLENNIYLKTEDALKNIIDEKIYLEKNRIKHFVNGVRCTVNKDDGIYLIYEKESKKFIGLGEVKNNKVKRKYIESDR